MKTTCLGCLILLLLSSCNMIRYYKKKEAVVKHDYSGDTLYVNGYVFYDDVRNSWGISQEWTPYVNEDSVFTKFEETIHGISDKVVFKESSLNLYDTTYHRNWGKRFPHDMLLKIKQLPQEKGKLNLIPLIKLTQAMRSGMYFTSSGSVGGSRYSVQNQLELVVYVIKDNSILYSRAGFCLGEPYPAYDVTDLQHTLTQKDWDELVALVMKDYLERAK
jgi:hypothetical protein